MHVSARFVLVVVGLGAVATLVAAHCPNFCSGHGDCVVGNSCACWNSWQGGDCSERICPSGPAWADVAVDVDAAHQTAECSNRGTCDRRTGLCRCMHGYEGIACNRMKCPNSCSGHGSCGSMAYTAAHKDPGTGTVYTYDSQWDSNMIFGCTCDDGFEGYDCSLRVCPKGDDVMTSGPETAIQLFTCQGLLNPFYLHFRGEITQEIPLTATLTDVRTALEGLATLAPFNLQFLSNPPAASTATVCETGVVVSIEFLQQFGQPPAIQLVDSSSAVIPSSDGVYYSFDENTPLAGGGFTDFFGRAGTKENLPCSNRGYCNQESGICECYTGFISGDGNLEAGTRGDCGFAQDPISSCPGTTECSGHGVCSGFPEYACTCDVGWTSGDCSLRTCPVGQDWFALPSADETAHFTRSECSNKGICDRTTGKCECQEMFEGEACERMTCPGEEVPCNGHGRCVPMSELARFRETNGVLDPTSYGLLPNNPATWDFRMVFGCACDEGWQGYSCAQRTCPYGDDPTVDYSFETKTSTSPVLKVPEEQDLICTPTGSPALGYGFQLRFRDYTTPFIDGLTATIDDLSAALNDLPSIENVKVTMESGAGTDIVCTGPNVVTITFYSPSGDVPKIDIIAGSFLSSFTTLSLNENIKGTTDYLECSGRGLCNRVTGTCKCFIGYGSSNGGGLKGTRDDCGARIGYDPAFQFAGAGWQDKVRDEFRDWQLRGRDNDREFRLGSPFGRDTELDGARDRGWSSPRNNNERRFRGDLGFEPDWKHRDEEWHRREDAWRRERERW